MSYNFFYPFIIHLFDMSIKHFLQILTTLINLFHVKVLFLLFSHSISPHPMQQSKTKETGAN